MNQELQTFLLDLLKQVIAGYTFWNNPFWGSLVALTAQESEKRKQWSFQLG